MILSIPMSNRIIPIVLFLFLSFPAQAGSGFTQEQKSQLRALLKEEVNGSVSHQIEEANRSVSHQINDLSKKIDRLSQDLEELKQPSTGKISQSSAWMAWILCFLCVIVLLVFFCHVRPRFPVPYVPVSRCKSATSPANWFANIVSKIRSQWAKRS